jgi:predicted phage terminase large subunit-like protein
VEDRLELSAEQAKKVLEECRRELCKRRFVDYCEYVHEGRWKVTRFHKALCDKVQGFITTETGNPYDVLIIVTSPQVGKSTTVTETLPSWCLVRNPEWRVIIASYGEAFAEKFGRANRHKIEKFGGKFGIALAKNPSGATNFELTNHVGGILSAGIMGGITGRPAELVVIDDPVKNRQEADSETYRARMWDEWLNSIKTRLRPGAKVVVILTRWHEEDFAGKLLANDPWVEEWRVPCEAEDGDILGRAPGDGPCPEIGKGNDWLHAFKNSYINDSNDGGLRAWNALYQGRPTSAEGNLIRRSWFRYYSAVDKTAVVVRDGGEPVSIPCNRLPESFDRVWQSWDCAFKDGERSDFVCGIVMGRRMADFFLLDMVHGRMDIMQTLEAITAVSQKWPSATAKLIEEKANGAAVIQMLRHKLGGIVAINPTESKVSRVNAVVPLIQGGNVYLPHPDDAKWVRGFLEECASFPTGSHDDMVDAFSQGLKFYMSDRKDASHTEIPAGTWVYDILKGKGWKDHQIRTAWKNGQIELYGEPKGWAR